MEENFAMKIREVASTIYSAELDSHRTEAELKRKIARRMAQAEAQGHKSAAAQSRIADEDDAIYDARVAHGVAKAMLAAAKIEAKAAEVEFETWRTKMASIRLERKAYGA